MSGFSHVALQQALYQKLSGDATLMALISAVYDFAPPAAAYPYVTLGDMNGRDWSTITTTGMDYLFAVRVYSREAGRKQAALIMERIHTLLHLTNLTITGQSLVMLRMDSSDIVQQDDGLTYQGILRFRALVEAV